MNVLLLTQLFSNKGGSERIFSLIAQLLANNDNNVWIITNKIKGEKYQNHKNIKFIFVPPVVEYGGVQITSFKENICYCTYAFVKGLQLARKQRIDIIHSNNFAPALSGSALSAFTLIPHIIYIQDVFSLFKDFWKSWAKENNLSLFNALLAPIFEKLLSKLKCSAIHTVSQTSRDDLVKFGAKKPICVIDNAINFNTHNNLQTKPLQFLYLGRLVFYKNLEIVIKAISIVKKSYPKINFVIAGDGPHKQNLIELVDELGLENNIEFKGQIPEDEKNRLISESQALVLPSLCEGFGLVILEAFEHKRPVIVSNLRPLSDIVSNSDTGLVVSAHDEKEWAKALMEIITQPDEGNKMGNAGRKLLETKYNTQIMYEKILQMYESATSR